MTDNAEAGCPGAGPVIAVSGTEFRDAPVRDLLDTADRVGVDALELWFPENFTATGSHATGRAVAGWGGRVVAVSAGVELGETHDVPHAVGRLIKAIEVADGFGCRRVNTYFGAPGFRDDTVSGDNFLRNIAPALRRAEQLGTTVVLENEFDAFGRDDKCGDLTRRPSALRALVQRSDSAHLRLNFDAANFYCAGIEPYPYAYGVVRDFIGYAHVKDVRLADLDEPDEDPAWHQYRDYDRSYVTTWLGAGAVNWSGLVDRLCADGYDGPLTLEPHARAAHRTAAFVQGVRWLRGRLDQACSRRASPTSAAS